MSPYEQIKKYIVRGTYKPGERLTEERLASDLNISRTPIRQAIHQLQFEGLVTPLKRGVIVKEFSKSDIIQIYNLRALLESFAAGEAALNRSEEDIAFMVKANNRYKRLVDQYVEQNEDNIDAIMQANSEFHEALLNAAKNEYLKFHLEKVVVLPLVFRSFFWYSAQEMLRSYQIHTDTIEAIKRKEPHRAKSAIKEHVYQARDHVLKHSEQIKTVMSKGESL